jgi:hypothetical protein
VEARGRGQRGENLGEAKGHERNGRRSSGNTVSAETDSSLAQSLGAAALRRTDRLAGREGVARNSKRGRGIERCAPRVERENLCRSKAHGRHPHETRRERVRME